MYTGTYVLEQVCCCNPQVEPGVVRTQVAIRKPNTHPHRTWPWEHSTKERTYAEDYTAESYDTGLAVLVIVSSDTAV